MSKRLLTPKNQGFFVVLTAIPIQLTLGTGGAWSVFQTGIANNLFGGDNAAASLTFSLLLATLTVGGVIGGKLATKYSTRRVVFIGGIISSLGFFLASFVTAGISWLLWVTYGLMGGMGIGFIYSTTIACVQKWYPHKKGLVTGILISALGFGGAVYAPIIENLISAFGGTGVGEPKAFIALSAIFLTICTVGSLFIKDPPGDFMMDNAASNTATAKTANNYLPMEMLKTLQFYLITATFLLACMGGLMMIGFAKPIAVAKGLGATSVICVMVVSTFNSFGRLFWGMISDKLGRSNTIIMLLSGTAICSLFVNAAENYLIYVLIALIGFFYGGLLSNFPSLTADTFGAKHMATNYGFVLSGFGIGGIVSLQIAGYYKNVAVNDISLMFPAFMIASCCAVAGIVMMLILKAMNKRTDK